MIRRLLSRWLPGEMVKAVFDYEERSRYILYLSLTINLLYAALKLIMGIYYKSVWMGALGIYYAGTGSDAFFSDAVYAKENRTGESGSKWKKIEMISH